MATPEIKQNIEAKQELQLRLAPSLIQTVKILQMPLQELVEHIEQEVIQNPFLETGNSEFKSIDNIKSDLSANILKDLDEERMSIGKGSSKDEETMPLWEVLKDETPDVFEKIRMQISISNTDEKVKNILYKVLDKVDIDGYLRISFDELLNYIKKETKSDILPDELKKALNILKTKIEPRGIGSTTITECLLSQLDPNDKDYKLISNIITNELTNDKLDINFLTSKYKLTHEEINNVFQTISKLNMWPLANYNNDIIRKIKPDAEIYYVGNDLVVNVSMQYLPKLTINNEYINFLKEEKAKEFLKNKYSYAKKLIKDINLRKMLLLKILRLIADEQKGFFENGIVSMKSLNLEMISQKTGLSISTISRVISNKYVQTPRGLFHIKFFLASSPTKNTKVYYSKVAICNKIKELIEQENKQSPYTDTQLKYAIDRELNIKLARRTITKFRLEMNIPSATVRKIRYETSSNETNLTNIYNKK